jgi:GDP-4-dehydro-6-deoxy-D-mannose reductase
MEKGLRAVRVRPFNHTGPGQTPDFVVPAFARQVARIAAGLQEPVLRTGNLEPKRDFLDVRDVCEAYAACLRTPLPPGAILNLASGEPRRVGDILHEMMTLAGITARIEAAPHLARATDIPSSAGDASRARTLLGWSPRIPWQITLGDVLADWRDRVKAG